MPTLTLSPELIDSALRARATARQSLEAFTILTKPDYEVNWHHRLLCQHLDRFARGQLRRLMVFMPPRHGKSELVSRRLPAYLLGRDPDASVIACSYSADLSSRMNRDVQRIIDAESYRSIFPATRLWSANVRTVAQGTWLRNSDVFEVVGRRGTYRSAGRGQGITGMGGRYLIIDDPLKDREESDSPTVRENLWEWYVSTFRTRLAPDGCILVTMTRWNEDDLAGRLLAKAAEDSLADQWTILSLPAVCEEPTEDDPRQPGEALWPSRYSLSELAKIKANSAYEWAALYQQHPRPEGGVEWPDDYFQPKIWVSEWPRDLTSRIIALDPSKGKDAKHGDYSAFVLLGRARDGVLYCEADLAIRPTSRIVQDGLELHRRFQADGFGVETNSFQEMLADEFIRCSREQGIQAPLFPIENMVNKEVRIRRLGAWLSRGGIRFVATPGTRLLVKQLREFPYGAHDDGPDALEMAIRLMVQLWHGRRGVNVVGRVT